MGRMNRILDNSCTTSYHVTSKSTLVGFVITDKWKQMFIEIVDNYTKQFFISYTSFQIMDDHFHLVLEVQSEYNISDTQVIERLKNGSCLTPDELRKQKCRLCDLSEFMKLVKQNFARLFNKANNKTGAFWAERFKSVILKGKKAVAAVLSYIGLNPYRAEIADKESNPQWNTVKINDKSIVDLIKLYPEKISECFYEKCSNFSNTLAIAPIRYINKIVNKFSKKCQKHGDIVNRSKRFSTIILTSV